MTEPLKNILNDGEKEVPNEKILGYLNNELSPEDQHSVEGNLNDDPFLSDALDGLEQFKDKADLPAVVKELNIDLSKHLGITKKKKRRDRRPDHTWFYYTLIIILLVCVVAYIIIRKYNA